MMTEFLYDRSLYKAPA